MLQAVIMAVTIAVAAITAVSLASRIKAGDIGDRPKSPQLSAAIAGLNLL